MGRLAVAIYRLLLIAAGAWLLVLFLYLYGVHFILGLMCSGIAGLIAQAIWKSLLASTLAAYLAIGLIWLGGSFFWFVDVMPPESVASGLVSGAFLLLVSWLALVAGLYGPPKKALR